MQNPHTNIVFQSVVDNGASEMRNISGLEARFLGWKFSSLLTDNITTITDYWSQDISQILFYSREGDISETPYE